MLFKKKKNQNKCEEKMENSKTIQNPKECDYEKENDSENDSENVSKTEPEVESAPEQQTQGENRFEQFLRLWAVRDEGTDPLDFIAGFSNPGEEPDSQTDPFLSQLSDSLTAARGFAEGAATDPAVISEAVTAILDSALQLSEGNISAFTLSTAIKGLKYDADLQLARQEGELAGRNLRIEEELNRMDGDSDQDSIPQLGGTPSMGTGKRKNSIFDVARY